MVEQRLSVCVPDLLRWQSMATRLWGVVEGLEVFVLRHRWLEVLQPLRSLLLPFPSFRGGMEEAHLVTHGSVQRCERISN